jgi:type IV pilus assembly protein PilV
MFTNRGFTILEILIALAILAVGVVGVAKMQVLNILGTSFNKDSTKATSLAQRAIEEFKNVPFGVTPTICGTTVDNMSITCSVSSNGTAPNRYNDITVNVSWNSKDTSIFTIISER